MSAGPNAAAAGLAAATRDFLRRHPPFDGMEADAIDFLASRVAVAYYPKGERILAPEHGEVEFNAIKPGTLGEQLLAHGCGTSR